MQQPPVVTPSASTRPPDTAMDCGSCSCNCEGDWNWATRSALSPGR